MFDMAASNASSKFSNGAIVSKPPLKRCESLPNFHMVCDNYDLEKTVDFRLKDPSKYSLISMYTETDLDQPTDYSLQYAEIDADIDVEDCCEQIITYYTEDTPFVTPFNFSTATSMTDLREGKTIARKICDKVKTTLFGCGFMSPDDPISYCDEGTPGCYSRVDSFTSLMNIAKIENRHHNNKGKIVTFGTSIDFMEEETPLMFSRSSSLDSLNSIEATAIQDDRSSVVSDFSRLTSGIISPSELPDSPSQTIPPSPKPRPNGIVYPRKTDGVNEDAGGVFKDDVRSFKMESTPVQFSTATSLSSLMGEAKQVAKKEDLSENEEDDDILAECINFGMKINRYSQFGSGIEKSDLVSDSITTYCTEDTPAILSHAGSHSDLSLLSVPGNDKSVNGENNNLENEVHEGKLEDQPNILSNQEEAADANKNFELPDHPSHHSSRSYLSDTSRESEEAFLQECILAAMPKNIEKPKNQDENLSDDDKDADILANCINIGIANNKYNQKRNEVDAVKSYCTEDTPAILSYAGSCFELSDMDDPNSDDDDDDEGLLAECVRFGMAKIAEKSAQEEGVIPSNSNVEANLSDDSSSSASSSSSSSSSSEASSSDEEELLQECILSGMSKLSSQPSSTTSHLTDKEKLALHQIIVEGMKKCQISQKPQKEDSTSDLTEDEHALLRQCILSGMPRNKNLTLGGPAANRDSAELTEADRLLLQQCILAGMPKMKPRKKKEQKAEEPGHNCCIHCPRNKNNVKAKKKYKEKVTENRDVLFVASQIYAIKKEVVHKSREEWV